MKRRTVSQWETLSDTYRSRLEGSGLARSDYLAGRSLSRARGHKTTPEHPEQAYKAPGRFVEYLIAQPERLAKVPKKHPHIKDQTDPFLYVFKFSSRDPKTGKISKEKLYRSIGLGELVDPREAQELLRKMIERYDLPFLEGIVSEELDMIYKQ